MGAHSQSTKIAGREPARLHPTDAQSPRIPHGDIVLISSERGRCLASAVLTDGILPGVFQLSAGAWYDPEDWAEPGSACVHGDPNVLTEDIGTSQGCTGQHAWVQIEKWTAAVPPIRASTAPPIAERRG